MSNLKYYVDAIRHGKRGMDLYYHRGEHCYVIKEVNANVVRCAIGESDVEYLLECSISGREMFRELSEEELKDFRMHREV